jgi:hypothetical protein
LPTTDIRLDVYAYGYSGITTENQIRVRIGSVLNEVVIPDNTYLFSKDDTIRIKSLGISSATTRRNNWIDNIANNFKVKNTVLVDSSDSTYNIEFFRFKESIEYSLILYLNLQIILILGLY